MRTKPTSSSVQSEIRCECAIASLRGHRILRHTAFGAISFGCFAILAPTLFAASSIPIPTPRPQNTLVQPQQALLSASSGGALLSGIQLTLQDAVFLGLRNNRTIKSAYIDRVSQKFDLRVAEDRFNPHVAITGNVGRQRIGNIGSSTIDVSPGISLLTKTGAAINFAWDNSGTWQNGADSFSSGPQLDIEQPLLRGAGIAVNMAPVQIARLGELVNRLQLKSTISQTIAAIIVAHRTLLAAQEELRLAQTAVDRAQQLLDINNSLIRAGRMAAVEAIQTEADLESQKLRVLQAREQVEASRFSLLDLLALDLSTKIVATEMLSPQKANTDVNKLLPIAMLERPDYQGQIYVIEQNQLGVTVAENQQLWDVSLYAQGRVGSQYAEGAGSGRIADITAGLKFTIPINDLSQKQQLVDANTGYQSAELQLQTIRSGIELQIRTSASQVDLLWQQLAVAEKSQNLALQAVSIEEAKLNAGRSTTFEVRSLEDALRDSETQLLDARISYMNALTQLDLQLGTTLATWHIDLKG